MRPFLLLLLIFLGKEEAFAQTPTQHQRLPLPCGTPSPSVQQLEALQQQVLPYEQHHPLTKGTATVVYLPIKVHVVRQTGGGGGLDETQIYAGLAATNEQFVQAHMQFYVAGPVAYIDDSRYYDFSSDNEEALCQPNDGANVLNLYFTHSATLRGGIVGGYSGTRVFIIYSHANLDRTFSHELGHYFGLIHTFDQSNSADVTKRELVARTNCETTGDWVCDTPADPSERPDATYAECEYTGTITDAQGQRYAPPTRNVMAFNFCGNQLTAGQLARMETWRALYRTNLAWAGPQPAAPTDLSATISQVGAGAFQQVRLQWQNHAADALGYFIERATMTSDYAAVGVAGPGQATFVDRAAPANQPVSYRVKPINASAALSNSVSVSSGLSYALPRYVNSNCGGVSADYLDEVNLRLASSSALLLRSAAIPCGSYNPFVDLVPTLRPGETYAGELKSKVIIGPAGGYYGQQYTAIWLDTNHNGSFSDPGELVFASPVTLRTTNLPVVQPVSFVVPAATLPGLTHLRVRTQTRDDGRVWDPDARAWGGAVEEYAVQIEGLATPTAAPRPSARPELFPNPTAGPVTLTVATTSAEVGQVLVLNGIGQTVGVYPLPAQQTTYTVPTQHLARGLYQLRIRHAANTYSQKLILQ